MQKSPVLVDSSFYIGMTRQGKNPLPLLTYLAVDRDLAVCGVIRAEVGRGIRLPKVRDAFHDFWDVMINVQTDSKLWLQAEDLAWKLDRRGKILPLTDIVIACCAMRLGATILTHDHQFLEIPGIHVAMSGDDL
ncbi:MAG: PilT protein domain protein [Prosthecobacter sp.]|nr:PilT protein domain protein [Prosthecobacter sp.]